MLHVPHRPLPRRSLTHTESLGALYSILCRQTRRYKRLVPARIHSHVYAFLNRLLPRNSVCSAVNHRSSLTRCPLHCPLLHHGSMQRSWARSTSLCMTRGFVSKRMHCTPGTPDGEAIGYRYKGGFVPGRVCVVCIPPRFSQCLSIRNSHVCGQCPGTSSDIPPGHSA